MEHYIIVIILIVIMGLLGGVINYFSTLTNDKEADKNLLTKSLWMGVAAAILVPLFLNTISSDVLKTILGDTEKAPSTGAVILDCFIFSGFCVIAAISSRRFIDDLYDKVIKIGKTADEAKKTAVDAKTTATDAKSTATDAKSTAEATSNETSDLKEAVTEPDEFAGQTAYSEMIGDTNDQVNPDMKKLLDAFSNSRFTYRTLKGLARDSGLSDQEASDMLNELKLQGRIKVSRNVNGNEIWKLLY